MGSTTSNEKSFAYPWNACLRNDPLTLISCSKISTSPVDMIVSSGIISFWKLSNNQEQLEPTQCSLSDSPKCSDSLEDQLQHGQVVAMVSWFEQDCCAYIVKSRTDDRAGNKWTSINEVFGRPGLQSAEHKVSVIIRSCR